MKKALSLILALVMCLSLWACGKDGKNTANSGPNTANNNNAEISGDNSSSQTSINRVPQQSVSNDGYGRMEYIAGDYHFRVGDTLDTFMQAGFLIDDDKQNAMIEPWGFRILYLNYETASDSSACMTATVLNECDTAQPALYCRVISINTNDEIKCEGVFENGVSTLDELIKIEGANELIDREIRYGLSTEDNIQFIVGFGNVYNCVKLDCNTEGNVLDCVEIIYVENLFSQIDYAENTSLGEGGSFTAISLLSQYFDTSSHLKGSGYFPFYDTLDVFLNTKTLSFTVEGKKVSIGQEGISYRDLQESGWIVNINDSYIFEPFSDNSHTNFYEEGICSINGKTIQSIEIVNLSENEVSLRDAYCGGVCLDNPNHPSIRNDAPSFDFYGITEKSSISDIVEKLGMPCFVGASFRAVHLTRMRYEFIVSENYKIWIYFEVDAQNNCIYSLDMSAIVQ